LENLGWGGLSFIGDEMKNSGKIYLPWIIQKSWKINYENGFMLALADDFLLIENVPAISKWKLLNWRALDNNKWISVFFCIPNEKCRTESD
jgi:hypothetical protein